MVVWRAPECRAAEFCLRTPPRPRHRGPNDVTQLLTSAPLIQIVDAYRASPPGHGHPTNFPRSPFFPPCCISLPSSVFKGCVKSIKVVFLNWCSPISHVEV